MRRSRPIQTAMLALVALPLHLLAQEPLPVGTTGLATLPLGEPATFVFDANAAGFLSVVLRAEGGADIAMTITDDDGQTLPDGRSDMDMGGDLGAEQLVVTIPYPGRYVVVVETFDGDAVSFHVGGSFLSTELAAAAADPDGKPSAAIALPVADSHQDSIDPSGGDRWDWYRIAVEEDGVLTVLTRGESDGDLRLEIYQDGAYREPIESSDQDMDGMLGNESVTMSVRAGQSVFVRVSSSSGGGQRVDYRLASGIIPG